MLSLRCTIFPRPCWPHWARQPGGNWLGLSASLLCGLALQMPLSSHSGFDTRKSCGWTARRDCLRCLKHTWRATQEWWNPFLVLSLPWPWLGSQKLSSRMLRESLPHAHPYIESYTDLAKSAAHRRDSSAGQRTRLEDLLLPGHLKNVCCAIRVCCLKVRNCSLAVLTRQALDMFPEMPSRCRRMGIPSVPVKWEKVLLFRKTKRLRHFIPD